MPQNTLYGFYFSQQGAGKNGIQGAKENKFFYQPKSIYGTDLETRFLDMLKSS